MIRAYLNVNDDDGDDDVDHNLIVILPYFMN
jgi:hypothetical protein